MTDTLEQLREAAMTLAGSALWSLSDTELLAHLDEAHRAELAVTAVKLHLIREAESRALPAADRAHSTAPWLGVRLRLRPVTARRLVGLGRALDRRPALDRALVSGVVNTEHAAVIAECVESLPAEAGPQAADEAEGLLIGWATDFDAIGLKVLADRILYYVAPEIAERVEAKALARLEVAAFEARAFTLSSPVDGRVRLRGSLDVEAAAIVEAALSPLCAPRTSTTPPTQPGSELPTATSAGAAGDRAVVDGRRPEQRRADALVEVCILALRTGELPASGGEPPQLSITVAYEPLAEEITARTPDYLSTLITSGTLGDTITLPGHGPVHPVVGPADGTSSDDWLDRLLDQPTPTLATVGAIAATGSSARTPSARTPSPRTPNPPTPRRQLGIGTLDNGARLTPTTIRRIACDARILPATLGTHSQILDIGRTKRLFNTHLRRALVLRDQGCAFPTCTRPPRWCDGHHIHHWTHGGTTTLTNAVLLCAPHHRLIHHSDWQVRLGHDGLPEFIPPAYLDLDQKPRRNIYHRRT